MMRTFATAVLAGMTVADSDISWTSNGKFKVSNAAFLNVSNYNDGSGDFLLASSFAAMGSGHVYAIPGIKDAVEAKDATTLEPVKLGDKKFSWPNDVQIVPLDVFGERAIVVPDGFLVPGHTNGGVYVMRVDSEDITNVTETVEISPTKKGFFYHMGFWIDMNGDGRADFITARSNAKEGKGELVWFEHPAEGLDVTPWNEHIVVVGGPDVGIEADFMKEYPGEVVIWAAEFFNERVAMYRVSLTDGTLVDSRVIDDTEILSAYSVSLVDLNNDGTKQLMVNNHQKKAKQSGIWAYELPDDLMTGDFVKNTIATGFKPAFDLLVPQMAPGFPYAIWPGGEKLNERAHIFVAGDGDYECHVLVPVGDDPTDFQYEDYVIENAKGVVGALAFSDLDQDGWVEMWMPNYDKSTVELYTFNFNPVPPTSARNFEEEAGAFLEDYLDVISGMEEIESFLQ